MNGIVATAVMRVPEARRRYRERLAVLHTNVFKVDALAQRIDQLARVIRPYKPDVDLQADKLKRQIAGRAQSLKQQLQMSEPASPRFVDNVAVLSGWLRSTADKAAGLDEVRIQSSLRVLRIQHENPAISAWVTRVVLPGGTYEFVGRARTQRLEPLTSDRDSGAALRTSAPSRTTSRRLQAASDWEELRCRFVVRGPEEMIDLVCELRNARGEAWFDLESLRLQRLNPTAASRLWNLLR
jgi:hypothetical protein